MIIGGAVAIIAGVFIRTHKHMLACERPTILGVIRQRQEHCSCGCIAEQLGGGPGDDGKKCYKKMFFFSSSLFQVNKGKVLAPF